MMITKNEIDSFIEKIPPSPAIIKETLLLVNQGELTKAAKVAGEDIALRTYLRNIVNKPIYGFSNDINDISQIFAILGLSLTQQTIYNYMVSLLNPSKWVLFKLNKKIFYELQADLSKNWEKILKHLNITDKEIYNAISLLPSSIIIIEALFFEHIKDVKLLREVKAIDYNTILNRLCGVSLFDICEEIARKWDMDEVIYKIIQASSGTKPSNNKEIDTLGKWMHLLLFYELSKPIFIEAGLNDFIDFQIDFVSDIYSEFATVMEIL